MYHWGLTPLVRVATSSILELVQKEGNRMVSRQIELFNLDVIIDIVHFNKAHDRFLLIDDEVYHIGASIKDLGKKWFAFTRMRDIRAEELIDRIRK